MRRPSCSSPRACTSKASPPCPAGSTRSDTLVSASCAQGARSRLKWPPNVENWTSLFGLCRLLGPLHCEKVLCVSSVDRGHIFLWVD